MPIYDDVTQLIGNTPLVRINRVTDGARGHGRREARVLQPRQLGQGPHRRRDHRRGRASPGELQPGGTIVEATSGNTGIALAMVGAARGYKVVLTMPESMSKERRALLRAYGAELVLTARREGMKGAVDASEEIAEERGGVLAAPVRQRGQPGDPPRAPRPRRSGRTPTAAVDIFVAGIGTGGTITGVGQVLKERKPGLQVVAVEPRRVADPQRRRSPARTRSRASAPTSSPRSSTRSVYDEVIDVDIDDRPCEWRAGPRPRRACSSGISSGAALAAAAQVAQRPENAGKTIVVIIPSFGERYLSTVLFEGLVD